MIAVYARVSGEEQALRGYSLPDQLAACRDLAKSINIREYVDDGYSGAFLDRPGLDRLREDIEKGIIETVIMYDPDRMSRELAIMLVLADEFEKYNVQLRFVTGDYDASPEGRLFFSMKGAFSAYERAKIRERTNNGKRRKVKSGRILQPNAPFGYDWDPANHNYTINENEAEIVRRIFKMYIDRVRTLEIAKTLNEQGIRSRKGGAFSPNYIWRIIQNERYAGTAWQFVTRTTKISQYKNTQTTRPKEEQIAVDIPAIITREEYTRAQELRAESRKDNKRAPKQEYEFKGVLRCSRCGHAMLGLPVKQGKYNYRYYICSKDKHSFYFNDRCKSRRIREDKLSEVIWGFLKEYAANAGVITTPENTQSIANLLENTEKKIASLTEKRQGFLKLFRDGLILLSEMEVELKKVQVEMDASTTTLSQLKRVEKKENPKVLTLDMIERASTVEQRRRLLLDLQINFFVEHLPNGDVPIHITF